MFVSLSIYISQKLNYMDILLGFVAVAFYGLCGIYGYGVGRVGIAGRVGTGDGLCYAHAGD